MVIGAMAARRFFIGGGGSPVRRGLRGAERKPAVAAMLVALVSLSACGGAADDPAEAAVVRLYASAATPVRAHVAGAVPPAAKLAVSFRDEEAAIAPDVVALADEAVAEDYDLTEGPPPDPMEERRWELAVESGRERPFWAGT